MYLWMAHICRSKREAMPSLRKPVVTRRTSALSGGPSASAGAAAGADDGTSQLRHSSAGEQAPSGSQQPAAPQSQIRLKISLPKQDNADLQPRGGSASAGATVATGGGSSGAAASPLARSRSAAPEAQASAPAASNSARMGSGSQQPARTVSAAAPPGNPAKSGGRFRLAVGAKQSASPATEQQYAAAAPAAEQKQQQAATKQKQEPAPAQQPHQAASPQPPAALQPVPPRASQPAAPATQPRSAPGPAAAAARPGEVRDPAEADSQQSEKPKWQQRRERPSQQQTATSAFPAAGSKRAAGWGPVDAGSLKRHRSMPPSQAPHTTHGRCPSKAAPQPQSAPRPPAL